MTTFHDLGLSKTIVATLSALGFEKATPIQEKAIPLVLEGSDLIGLAQTGTGKTAAFGLPMIEKLLADARRPDPRNIRALILAPTRELVNQIADNLRDFVKKTPLRVVTVVGGASINKQSEMLNRGTDILVATPGRLLDLVARKAVTLTQARYLVLDEADQMLDLGFIHDLRKISKLVPKTRQTLLFSATMPKLIAELAGEYLTNPKKVEVTPPGKAADKVEQYVHFVPGKDQKTQILRQSLTDNPDGLSLVFSRTKHGAEKLMKHLDHLGFKAASIHGNKSQGQRERALKAFRDGEIRVLVATDVAARGIGRTARAGRDGIAIAFCAPDDVHLLRDIERLMGIKIAVASGEAPVESTAGPGGKSKKGRNSRGGGQRAGNGRAAQRPQRQPFGDGAQAEAGAAAGAKRPQHGRPAQKQGERQNRNHGGGNGQPGRPQHRGKPRRAEGQRREQA